MLRAKSDQEETIDAQPEGEPASAEAPIVASLASKTVAVEAIVNR
jgi:hypothetical protein